MTDLVAKAQEIMTSVLSAPDPTDTPFVKNARPWILWVGAPGLVAMGLYAISMRLDVLAGTIALAIAGLLRETVRYRSQDAQATTAAASEDKKMVVSVLSTGAPQ